MPASLQEAVASAAAAGRSVRDLAANGADSGRAAAASRRRAQAEDQGALAEGAGRCAVGISRERAAPAAADGADETID